MNKTFNSKTAKQLAEKYKLNIDDIPTTRKNNKITIQNVKDANKSKKLKNKTEKKFNKKDKSKLKSSVKEKEIIGYNVILTINPKINKNFNETISNMKIFKKWIKDEPKLPSVKIIASSFKNEKVKVLDNKTLQISFYVDNNKMNEVNYIIDYGIKNTSLDDDGNYPVFIDQNGNIYLERTNTPEYVDSYYDESYGDANPYLVSLKIINKTINKVYN